MMFITIDFFFVFVLMIIDNTVFSYSNVYICILHSILLFDSIDRTHNGSDIYYLTNLFPSLLLFFPIKNYFSYQYALYQHSLVSPFFKKIFFIFLQSIFIKYYRQASQQNLRIIQSHESIPFL